MGIVHKGGKGWVLVESNVHVVLLLLREVFTYFKIGLLTLLGLLQKQMSIFFSLSTLPYSWRKV